VKKKNQEGRQAGRKDKKQRKYRKKRWDGKNVELVAHGIVSIQIKVRKPNWKINPQSRVKYIIKD